MRKITLLLLFFAAAASAQNIAIPDPFFKARLLEADPSNAIAKDNMGNNIQIDANGDGEISISEAMNVYSLDVSNPDYDPAGPFISDMTGIDGFANLRNLDCAVNQLTTLDLTFLGGLQTIDCHSNEIDTLVLGTMPQLAFLDCSNNNLPGLDVTAYPTLQHLNCAINPLGSIDILPLTNLNYLRLAATQLTSITFPAMPNITTIDVSANQLTSIDLNGFANLMNLSVGDNQLTSIDLTPVPNLVELDVRMNSLASINIGNLTSLRNFSCDSNQISSLDFTGNPVLWIAHVGNNLLTALDLTPTPQLIFLDCSHNQISTLDISMLPQLGGLICNGNLLTTIDGSANTYLHNVVCKNNPIKTLFLKNGAITNGTSNFDFSGNPDLEFICADEAESAFIQLKIVEYGYTGCVLNTYCSFTPGGDYNTINGVVTFDANSNGCDSSDPKQPNIKLSISDGTTTGASFTDYDGNYVFYTPAGNFTVTPQVENPSFFTFSPADASAAFANANNNVSTNDFCVTPNGIHPDVEVVVAPLNRARPGFDAEYLIVYKNKGNQTLSGDVTFNYDESVLDLISVNVAPNVQNAGTLQWNYTNLLPFEARGITVVLNVNSPVETPPVNLDDILTYTVSVNPTAGDESPGDNQFTLNQTVVNAFDPNEIICLEGASVPVDSAGEYLHYIANFENLGTAEAENVVVRIDVDAAKYDINSLQLLNTSHQSYTRVTGNTVEFIFEGINLAAAEGNPPVGGHGNVLFKIKSNESLTQGDFVDKFAKIYFDYNFPIDTDIAHTVFQTLANPEFTDESIAIFPNPTKNTVSIRGDFHLKSVSLFDVQGRILETSVETSSEATLDLSQRSTGIYFVKITSEKGVKVMKLLRE